MPTTPRGLTYPASTGHTRLWEHLQTLAEDVDDQLTELAAQPHAIIYGTAGQSIPNASGTPMVLNGTESAAGCTVNGPTGEVTIVTGGLYHISGTATFAANATGYRQVTLAVNGAAVGLGATPGFTGGYAGVCSTIVVRLVPGDVVQIFATQSSGGSLALGVPSSRNRLSVTRIGD